MHDIIINNRMDETPGVGYKSACQRARKVTECWAGTNLYCMACYSDRIEHQPCNTEAIDFTCPNCSAPYQLKASRMWNERRVPDAGYDAMVRTIQKDRVPNLLIMQYTDDWYVRNLLLIPSFFFSLAAIQKRKPLSPNARRAGWVGCNILLSEIADEGKISVISKGTTFSPAIVREKYNKIRPLSKIRASMRGWTLDVFRMIHQIGQKQFSLQDIYRYESDLSSLYPDNRNVRPKIRQQLQVLRDYGFLKFEGRGLYRLL
jgi:type II restriction enzyme